MLSLKTRLKSHCCSPQYPSSISIGTKSSWESGNTPFFINSFVNAYSNPLLKETAWAIDRVRTNELQRTSQLALHTAARRISISRLQSQFNHPPSNLLYFSHVCTTQRAVTETKTEKCSNFMSMVLDTYTLNQTQSGLDVYTESEVMEKLGTWSAHPETSPDCIFTR